MALLVGVGGRNSHAFEPVVTFMEASSRDAVVLFVNLGSRYHVCVCVCVCLLCVRAWLRVCVLLLASSYV